MTDKLVSLMISMFGVNWKTRLNGWLLLICGGETAASTFNIIHVLSPDAQVKANAICGLLIAFGVLSAKANNVSNAPVPDAPKPAPKVG